MDRLSQLTGVNLLADIGNGTMNSKTMTVIVVKSSPKRYLKYQSEKRAESLLKDMINAG